MPPQSEGIAQPPEVAACSRGNQDDPAKTALKLLKSIGDAAPKSGSLAGSQWAAFDTTQLGGLLRESARPGYSETWMGLENAGWIRDAFIISGTRAWEQGAFQRRFGRARFSVSIALRAACQDKVGRLWFMDGEFHVSNLKGFGLVRRVNEEFWTPNEVLEEAHGLYTGSLVVAQVLKKAGAEALGEAMTATLRAHRGRTVEILGKDRGTKSFDWVD